VAWTADHRGSTPPKSFFESLPRELEEAAQIDGLGWFGIFVRIVLPLSKAVLATMILFYAVGYWNDWFTVGRTSAIISPNIQAVTMILAIVPILFIYPFVQRHFVSGVMLGSVKG